jgi:ankyrin repeat protein
MMMMTADSSDSSTSFESFVSSAVTPNIGGSSSCRTHAVLGKIASWILERERAQCSLDANVLYDSHSRYFRPVEVASSIERLIRRCEASLTAVESVLTHPHHHRQHHHKDGDGGRNGQPQHTSDYKGRRSCDATTSAGPGLWLLLSATNLESECATALLHLAVALDSPLACAALLVAAIESESSEVDDDDHNDENDDELQYVNEHPQMLYSWLLQEASINGSARTLKLLLENAPRVIHRNCGDANDAEPERSRRIDATPFRPCRVARSDAMQFLERLANTMLLLDDATTASAENPCWNDGWDDDSSLALELHHSPSLHASLSSSSYGPSAPHLTAVIEEWDELVERIRSRSEDPEDVEPSCAQSLLRSSMMRSTSTRQVSGDQGERSSSSVTQLLLSPPCGSSPLHWASYKGYVECAALLLENGADPNVVAIPTGWTPLHDAAYSNSTHVMELLLAAGSNVNATAASGATPLCFACQEDAANAALLLLQHNATVLASPVVVHSAAATMTHSGPAPLLPASRVAAVPPLPFASSSVPSSQQPPPPPLAGYTPLHYCARFNSAQAARVLLSHCQRAAELEDEDTRLQTLLDAPDFYGRRSLDIACIRASVDVLYELLHQGATVAIRSIPRPREKVHRSNASNVYSASFPTPAAPRTAADLRSMIPKEPVLAPKPWNCLTQESIDGCHALLARIDGGWTTDSHELYTPEDRAAIDAVRTDVSDDLERTRGVYRDAWPVVLSYCGRGWFRPSAADGRA